MKEETARQLYEALDHACTLLNAATKMRRSPDDIVKSGIKLLPGVPPKLRKAAETGGAMGFLRALTPEPSEEEKANIKAFLGELPFLLRKALVQARKEVAGNLPYRRGKPTPAKLRTTQQKEEACNDVDRLLPFVENVQKACEQVGKKYGASSRTIRRIWSPHHKAMKSAKPSDR
jgi:hypothetical protein